MRRLLARAYESLRGRPLPAEIGQRDLFEFGTSYARSFVTGLTAGARCSATFNCCFVGRRVKIQGARHLKLGRYVALGDDVSISAYGRGGISLGDRVTVARGAHLAASGVLAEPGEGIQVGNHTAIGMYNVIWGQGGVTIGPNCLLGPHVVFVSENHTFADPETLVRDQGSSRAPIVVEEDCWLGTGAFVGPGVRIGRGSIVGAHSVVTKDLPPLSIAVGAPARRIGTRGGS